MMLNHQQVVNILETHQGQLKKFAVKTLLLFGSVARGEAHAESDIDLLVDFEQPLGLFTFIELKEYLEEIFNCSVDLGTLQSLRPHLREIVLKEAIRAF